MVTRPARGAPLARCAVILAALVTAAAARADSVHLAEARRAIAAVDYAAARRLLVEALQDGGNSPAAIREIYRLSARAAVVLGQRDLAEQYYRRWLAIDPDAALPDDTAPKLREPFIAAEAYIAAHGRLRARAHRVPGGAVDVELLADPLAMAQAAVALAADAGPAHRVRSTLSPTAAPTGDAAGAAIASPVVFDADHHARLPATAAQIAVVDDRGNHLLVLEPEAGASAAATVPAPPSATATDGPAASSSLPMPPEAPPRSRRWLYWAVPTGVFALGAAGFGIAAIASYGRAHEITTDSGKSFLSDAEDNVRRGRIFAWITIGAGAAMTVCAIPTVVYLVRDRGRSDDRRAAVIPTIGPGQLGIALGGRF